MARARVNVHLREVSPPKFHFLHFEVFYLHVKINKSRWSTRVRQMQKRRLFRVTQVTEGALQMFLGHLTQSGNGTYCPIKKYFLLSFLARLCSVSNTRLIAGCVRARSAWSLFRCELNVFAKAEV